MYKSIGMPHKYTNRDFIDTACKYIDFKSRFALFLESIPNYGVLLW